MLLPGIVGILGSMAIRLRLCTKLSTPPLSCDTTDDERIRGGITATSELRRKLL